MSEIKVNKITPRVACGTTQLGDSGDTITIPSGATITNAGTASGFGATGETSWDTTVKTTGTFTATAGVGYFLNTTGGVITVNLPVGAAGSSVAMTDYAETWQTNNVTVAPNGAEKMGGVAASATLNTQGQSVTFVYIDGTQGWVNVLDSTSNVRGATYIAATGGTIATVCTNYKTHTFTGPGTFCVSAIGNPGGSTTVDYMVVGGGGGAGGDVGGGGGAGGFRESPGTASGCYSVSPLGAAPAVALPVSVQGYSIVVGGGGAGGTPPAPVAVNGVASSFSTITSAGGGGSGTSPAGTGLAGGSGGGGARYTGSAGVGNTPPTNPAQGTAGAGGFAGAIGGGGGGGGATDAGTAGVADGGSCVSFGGDGATTSISGTPTAYTGGGGGGMRPSAGAQVWGPATGGTGGGGNGGWGPVYSGIAGTVNKGGGGGGGDGGGGTQNGGAGGSGVVIIRYKFQ
jgi:hypothetical protein